MNLFDTNIFIQHDHFCRRDVFISLWDWLANNDKNCCSIIFVYNEISPHNSALTAWANSVPSGYFIDNFINPIQTEFQKVSRYVVGNFPVSQERTNFLAKADPWLIATAMHNNADIITFEKPATPNSTKPKIPDVASYFGITCHNFFDFCRNHNIKF